MNQQILTREPIMPLADIPQTFRNVQLTQLDRERLSMGETTSILNNLVLDGRVMDAKLRLLKDKDGKVKWNVLPKEEQLVIPESILEHRLDENEKNRLLKGEKVGPIPYKGSMYNLRYDKELNSIIVQSMKQVRMDEKLVLGKVEFTSQEKEKLMSGQMLDTKVFEVSNQGKKVFFSASLSFNKDTNEYFYTHYKELNDKEALKLKEELSINKEGQPERESINNLSLDDSKAFSFIKSGDIASLSQMKDNGYKPTENLVRLVCQDPEISDSMKVNALTVMNIPEPVKKVTEEYNLTHGKNTLTKGEKQKEETQEKGKSAKSIGEAMHKIVNSMAHTIE